MQERASQPAQVAPHDAPDQSADDEVAATQQSILEELHTISEEAITGAQAQDDISAGRTGLEEAQAMQEVQATDAQALPDSPGPIELPAMPETKPTSSLDRGLSELTQLADGRSTPTAGGSFTTVLPSLEQTAAIAAQFSEAKSLIDQQAEPVTTKTVTAEQVADEPVAAETNGAVEQLPVASPIALSMDPEQLQEAFADTPQQQVVHAIQTEAAVELATTMAARIDADLDHTDLFDGIDADAFDDIELSPPVRRQHALPSIEGTMQTSDASAGLAATTRVATSTASQSLRGLELTLGTDDAPSEPLPASSQLASFLDPQFAGFKTGRNKPVQLSEQALERARKLMLDLDETSDPIPPPIASQLASSQLRPLPISSPAREPLRPSNGGFIRPTLDRTPMQEIIPKQTSIMPNGSQGPPSPSKGKSAATQRMTASTTMPTSQGERQPFATPKPMRNGLSFSSAANLSSPMRTPVAAAFSSASRFTTPQLSKRNSLGMMPRVEIGGSTGRKRALPRFVTPFKNGKRPRADEAKDPASPLRTSDPGVASGLCHPSPVANRHYPAPQKISKSGPSSEGPAVFNLCSTSPRQKLSDVGRPESVSALQMIAKGVPDEVLVILNDASRASQYAFESATADLLQQQHALDELHSRGCVSATLPWVSNHWSLILWKLAAMVRLDPSSAHTRWSWDELIRQLLYRYEREIHRAQRSCLKRIQEHDSSPARPMVLFVSKILEEEYEVENQAGEVVIKKSTLLELSDGWYRIQAQIDSVLASACQCGRLRVGQKLAIMGATLDAQGEGNEVLTAYHMSSLVLASNSVSLARWDAKLGFVPTPFFASLRSLTPEGGLVSLMDVVITKVFPLAYVDVERNGGKPSAPRGEQEEAEEQEAWLKRREDAMQNLELELESRSQRLYELVDALSELASDAFLPSIPDDPTGALEAKAGLLFDQLRGRAEPASAVRELVVAQGKTDLVPWLHGLAKSSLLAEEMGGGGRSGAELDKMCPPRKTREFRVVRFRDARLPSPPPSVTSIVAGTGAAKKKNPHARTVQLTVWDAAQLGEELQEGRRFCLTNLVPSSKSAWRKADEAADVFLSTRRDTKWRPVS